MIGRIVKRSRSSYTIIYDLPATDGSRRQVSKAIPGPKKNAERELARIRHELNSGTHVAPERLTVREFGARWLRDYGRDNLGPGTLEDYTNALRLYVYPTLGGRELPSIRAMDVQGLYTQLRESGSKEGGPLAPATVRVVHRILRRMFSHAVQWQVLPRNPIEGATPPREKSEKPPVLQDAEAVEALLETARGTWLYLPTLLAVSLTLRRGEALALRWRHVNFEERDVHICEALRETRTRGVEIAPPKTAAGIRHIPMPGFLVDELETLRSSITPWDENRLLICKRDGQPFRPEGLSHAFGKLAEQAGCPEITFHALRHTSITFLLKRGVPAHVVSKIAGHASVQVTLGLYAHVLKGMERSAITEMDDFLPRRKSSEHS